MFCNSHNRFLSALFILTLLSATAAAQYGGTAGAFSRIAFGPRGLAMGNAMTAVTTGDLYAYYNPASSAYQKEHSATVSYTILSLDRTLNFLQYSQHLRGSAGGAIGVISSGVSNIDGRDNDGVPTGTLSTSENVFFASFGNSFGEHFSAGLTFKYYYYSLYQGVSANSPGADLGAIYTIDNVSSLGICVQDLGVKYRWDTANLYGESGASTIDEFPTIFKFGYARTMFDSTTTASVEYVTSSRKTHELRLGAEWTGWNNILTLRLGCDRIDLKDKLSGAMPTVGFAVTYPVGSWRPTIQYAYGAEPFAPSGMHMIAVTVGF